MQFVALGQTVQLTASIPKKFTHYKNATLNLRLNHGGTTDTLLNTRVQLSEGTGTRAWTATGLTAKELSAIVDVTWTGQGMFNKTVTQQLFVYRTEVELLAVDADRRPISGAAYELTMRVHPQYTGQVAPVQLSGRTNGEGKATISNLPPLQSLEVRWKNPNLLSAWVTADDFTEHGALRKATLRAGYRAQLVGVAANDSLTRYVNVPLDVDDASAGPLVSIRAKVHADDGGGVSGDKIWARVTWGEHNCKRSDKSPKLEEQSLVAAAGRNEIKLVVEKQLGSDGGEVVFNFDCGVAGGDRFSIWVGGDPEAEDDGPVLIVTKRKLRLIPHFPPNYPFADRLFGEAFKQKLIRALAVAEIELEITDPQTITYAEQGGLNSTAPPKEVSAEVSERLGWEREIHFVYTDDMLFAPLHAGFREVADYPTIRAFYADRMLRFSSVGQPFKVEGMSSRTSEWMTSGSTSTGFLPCDLDGGSVLTVFRRAKPEEKIYEHVYLWDEDAGEDHFIGEGAPDKVATHVWAVDPTVCHEVEFYSRGTYPVYKAKLLPKDKAALTGRNIVPLNESGLPEGYVFETVGYAERTLVETRPPVPEAWGEWRTADGNLGPITMDHIEIDMGEQKYMRFRFELPEEAQPGPGNLATATVGIRTASAGIAGESSGCAIILLNNEGQPTDSAAQALLHEVGHSFGQSWAQNYSTPPGVAVDRKYLYGTSIRGGSGNRGHQGPHCAYGLADRYLDNSQDYSNLLAEEGIHGTCVMFGGIGPRTVYSDQTRQFCPVCLPTIKSQDLSKIDGGQS